MRPPPAGPSRGRFPWDERGSVMAMVVFGITILLMLVAFAVHLGLLYTARAEAQRVADLAAHAGAGALVVAPGDEALARRAVLDLVRRNRVVGEEVDLLAGDVEVLPFDRAVRVTVRRTGDRGRAVTTAFARLVGMPSVDVVATATAEVSPAGGLPCPLPLAIPDRWWDADRDGRWDAGIDVYDPVVTGYRAADVGTLIEIAPPETTPPQPGTQPASRPGAGGACVGHPGRACWFDPGRSSGMGRPDLVAWVEGCPDPSLAYRAGDVLRSAEPSGTQGAPMGSLAELVDVDPAARWHSGCGCVTRDGLAVTTSPRLRGVLLVAPASVVPGSGGSEATVVGLGGLFLEKVAAGPGLPHRGGARDGWRIYARLARFHGVGAPAGDSRGLVGRPRIVR